MNQDIWSYAILFLIAQGGFVFSVLLFSGKRRRKHENIYLMLLVLVFIWFLCEFYSVRNVLKVNFNLFYGTRYGSWLILGPLTFFFFKAIIVKSWQFKSKDLLHFVPFLLFTLAIPLIRKELVSPRQIHYGMLAVFDYRPKTVTPFEYLYATLFYLQFLHLGVYLFLNLKRIKTYRKQLKEEYAALHPVRWLYIFNITLIGCLILASTYLYLLFNTEAYTRSLDYIYVMPMGLFLYAVGYKLSGMEWLQTQEEKKRYQSSSLKLLEKEAYIKQLQFLMETEKPFLRNDLRSKDLAALLTIPNHHLSQLINESFGYSFFDYINKHRVQEAKLIIQNNTDFTLLKVAFEAGFNNKTSFINAFKKFEKQTPSTFRKHCLTLSKV